GHSWLPYGDGHIVRPSVCTRCPETNTLSATIASIVRTVVMADALTVYRYDVTWMGYEVWIWLIVECNLAIICISVPVLRPLVRKYLPCLSMTTRNSKGLTSFTSGSIFRRTSVRV